MSPLDIDKDRETAVGEARARLHVLLAYEDFSTGLRARQAFEPVARQIEVDADFNVTLWNFDLLREPVLIERAATEAAKADIVFLSAHGQGELPGAVDSWLKQWFERRGAEPCALVVLLDTEAGDTEAPNRTWEALRATALAAGLDVFRPAPEALQTERAPAVDEITRPLETRTALPAHLLRSVELSPYWDWGINE
jgi:hypothetical protein